MEYHFARDHLWSFTSDAYVRSGWMAHEKSAGSSRRHVQPNRRDSPQNPFEIITIDDPFCIVLDCGAWDDNFSTTWIVELVSTRFQRRETSHFVGRSTMMHRSVAYANWTKGCSQTGSSRLFQQSRVKSRSRRASHNLGIDVPHDLREWTENKHTHTQLKDAMTREGESRARAVAFAGEK